MCKKILVILLFVALPVFASTETIIDFEQLSEFGNSGALGANNYSEDGYIIETESELAFITLSDSIFLYNRIINDTITISNINGQPFDLLSINFRPYIPGQDTITFTGILTEGGTVTKTLTGYVSGPTTIYYEDFVGLSEVSWDVSGSYLHFDNITIVPEPTSLALLAIGGIKWICSK